MLNISSNNNEVLEENFVSRLEKYFSFAKCVSLNFRYLAFSMYVKQTLQHYFGADYRGEHLLTKFCVTRKIWTKVIGLLFFESDKFSIFILKFAGLKKGLLLNLFCLLHIHRSRAVDPQHRVRDILRYSRKKNPAFTTSVATKMNPVQLLKLLLLLSQRHLTQWNLDFFWTLRKVITISPCIR